MLHYSQFFLLFFLFFSSALSPNSRGVWNRGSAAAEGFFIVGMRADSQMENFFFPPSPFSRLPHVFSSPRVLFRFHLDVLMFSLCTGWPFPPLPVCTLVSQSILTYSPSSRLDFSLRPVSSRLLLLLLLPPPPTHPGSSGFVPVL